MKGGPVSARVLDEAIGWQLRLGAGEVGDQERRAFDHWHAAHPEHARVWAQLGALDTHLAPAAPAPARRALLRADDQARRRMQRAGRGLAGLFLLAGLGLGLLAQQRPLGDYLADERTASGEQRELQLTDRTRVRLNSRSALDIDFDAERRRIVLRSGEILVETGHGDPRPFVVATADGDLRPLGTRFLVRREAEGTRLVVLRSAVAARPVRGDGERIIREGQQVLMHDQVLEASQVAPLAADAWTRGMLVVEDVRLADLLERLGEYRPGYLGVDSAIADLRISGSFPLHDSDRALSALPPSLPVRIERYNDWFVRVVPKE